MANDETVKVRLPKGLLGECRAAAGPRGFSEFVRGALQDRLARERPVTVRFDGLGLDEFVAEPVKGPRPSRAARREPCEHRLPPASFCKVCDQ